MELCPDCGYEMKRTVWTEEAWGRPYRQVEYSCENPHCGDPECEDCGRYTDDLDADGLCDSCRQE